MLDWHPHGTGKPVLLFARPLVVRNVTARALLRQVPHVEGISINVLAHMLHRHGAIAILTRVSCPVKSLPDTGRGTAITVKGF